MTERKKKKAEVNTEKLTKIVRSWQNSGKTAKEMGNRPK